MLGALIGGALSLFGSSKEAKAAEKAADAQVQAAKIAADEQKRQFDAMMNRTEPQYQLGLSALGKQAFYAGVGAPAGFSDKLSEIGAPQYPSMNPYGGQTAQQTYMPAVQSPASMTANYLPPNVQIQNRPLTVDAGWLDAYLKQAQGG
jgi:hypothetical protein